MNFRTAFLIIFGVILGISEAIADPTILETLKGLGAVTTDAKYNPINGVITETYLKGIRYKGNYGTKNQEENDPLLKCIVKDRMLDSESLPDNCPQDVVTSLIQWLFPNATMDGNFAPNRRNPEFKDLVSRFTPATIGSILNAIASAKGEYNEKLVFSIAQGILEEYTKSKQPQTTISKKEFNPENLYKEYIEKFKKLSENNTSKSQFDTFQNVLDYLEKYNKLSPNEKKQVTKPLKEDQMKISLGISYNKALNPPKKKKKEIDSPPQEIKIDETYVEQAKLFAEIVVASLKATNKHSSSQESILFLQKNEPKIDEKIESRNEEIFSYNPISIIPQQEIYYPDIVTMALLHFAWTISKDKNDIVDLLQTMPSVVDQQQLQNYMKSDSAYNAQEYLDLKNKILEMKSSEYVDKFKGSTGLELATILVLGFQYFEMKFPKKIGYTMIPLFAEEYNPNNPKQQRYDVKEKEKIENEIPDCGESSLRTVLMFLFFNPESRFFDIEPLLKNAKLTGLKIHPLLIEFFKKYFKPDTAKSYGARADWMRTSSFLNNGIEYVKKAGLQGNFTEIPVCEIEAGLSNMMKVLGAFLGLPSSQNEENFIDMTPLNTLLKLVSTEENKWEWKTSEDQIVISKEKNKDVKIDFYQNEEKIFTWEFEPGHFDTVAHLEKEASWLNTIGQGLFESEKLLPVYFPLFIDETFIFNDLKELHLTSENLNLVVYSQDFEDEDKKTDLIKIIGETPLDSLIPLGKRLIDSLKDLALADPHTSRNLIRDSFWSYPLATHVIKILGLQENDKPYDGKSFLHIACEHGNFELVKLFSHLDVNGLDSLRRTPLAYATSSGNLEIVKYLIGEKEAGLDVGTNRYVFLINAVESGNPELVKYIVEKKVSLNETEHRGRNALHIACYRGNIEIIKYLLSINSKYVDSQDKEGLTPLHIAVERGNLETVKVLVENDAKVDLKNKDGLTSLDLAKKLDKQEIINYLLSATDTIFNAIINDDLKTVQQFIEERKIDINLKDKLGMSPLHLAVKKNEEQIVQYLIKNNANVHIEDNDGRTPLFYAISNKNIVLIKLLIQHKANINAQDKFKVTPVLQTCEIGDLPILKYLVSMGAQIDAMNSVGRTALHLAALKGYLNIVQYLVEEKKADVNAKDQGGNTPLDLAAKFKKNEVVEYLNEQMSGGTIFNAIGKHDLKAVQQFVEEKKIDINQKNKEGMSPLHVAVKENQEQIAQYLMKNNANVDIEDNDGRTPLFYATINNDVEIIKLLINNRTNVNIQDKNKTSPLHLAAKGGDLNVFKELASNNTDINVKDSDEKTPLHFAAALGKTDIVKYLVEEKKADMNAKNKNGKTPLDSATTFKKKEIVEYLNQKMSELKN